MMKHRKVAVAYPILVILLLIISTVSRAQISQGGLPLSFTNSALKSTVLVPTVSTNPLDIEKLLLEDLEKERPVRYSVFEDVLIDIKERGVEISLPEEQGRLWLYNIESENALSIQLFFNNYILPEGAMLHIYNKEHSIVYGAFTAANNNKRNQLMIADLFDQEITIEYFEPNDAEFEGLIELGSVGLSYKNFLKSGTPADASGYVGINTPEGEEWQNDKHAVCKISFREGVSGYICTGALLNNSDADGTPYFLTADHCISTDEVAGTLVSIFNYETYGGSGETFDGLSLSGAQLLSHSDETDFCLLLLNETPAADYQPYYAAWNATEDLSASSVGIHHPQGTPKKISLDYDSTASYDEEIGWEGGSVTPANTHWQVLFDHGATAGGSSGSPLFNADHQVIGQLHGGSEDDFYGKLSGSFNLAGTIDIGNYLNPGGLNPEELTEGYYPEGNLPDPQIFPEFQTVCANSPIQLTGMSAFEPLTWLWSFSPSTVTYAEGSDANSKEPVVLFEDEGAYDVSMTVTNAAGSETRAFPGTINVGTTLIIDIMPVGNSKSCLSNFDSLQLVGYGAEDYLWELNNDDNSFYIVDETANPITIKMNQAPNAAYDLLLNLTGSHGTCSELETYTIPLIMQSNDSIKDALEVSIGSTPLYSNQCAGIEENEPVPSITACTGNSWCDEFGTGEDILGNSVWFYFIPEQSGKFEIKSFGMDNQIAVYHAESTEQLLAGNYELIEANDDFTNTNANPTVKPNLVKGEKYLIQVDGSAGNITGEFNLVVSLISGIQDGISPLADQIKIYPQPVRNILQIEYDGFINSEIITADVYNISGTKVYTHSYKDLSSNSLELSFSELARGIYFIRLNVDDKIFMKKTIKY